MKITGRQVFWLVGLLKETLMAEEIDDLSSYQSRKEMLQKIMLQQGDKPIDVDEKSDNGGSLTRL